jgi:Contractile injection system tube protein
MSDSIPKPTKCFIKSLDTGDQVDAYFNPKELSIDKEVPWNQHKSTKSNIPVLEFTDAKPKTLSVELLFDGYEKQEDVHKKYISVLEKLTEIVDKTKKRPPMCLFVWGKKFPSFMGVIASVATKYTMFLEDGTPVRATATVKMTQAEELAVGQEEKSNKKTPKGDRYDSGGVVATQGDERRADRHGDDHRGTLDRSGSENGKLTPGEPVFGDLE